MINKVQMESTPAEGMASAYLRQLRRLCWKCTFELSLILKSGVLFAGRGNRTGEARQPERARSPQNIARLLGGPFREWSWYLNRRGWEGRRTGTLETRAHSHAAVPKGRRRTVQERVQVKHLPALKFYPSVLLFPLFPQMMACYWNQVTALSLHF